MVGGPAPHFPERAGELECPLRRGSDLMPLRRWAGPDAVPSVGEGRVLGREPREARRRPPDARGAAPGLPLQPVPGWALTDGPASR